MVAGRLDGSFAGSLAGELAGEGTQLSGDPSTLIDVADQRAWLRGDQGITEVAGRISAWADIWANASVAQAVGANQPLLSTLNGQASVSNDDGSRFMGGALVTSIPTGQRAYMWLYCSKSVDASKTWAMVGEGALTSPRISISNALDGTANASLRDGTNIRTVTMGVMGAGGRLLECGLTTGGVAAAVMSGASFANGTLAAISAGAIDSIGVFTFAGIASGSQGPVGHVAELVLMRGEPTGSVKAAMRNYFQARYGNI